MSAPSMAPMMTESPGPSLFLAPTLFLTFSLALKQY